MKMIDYMKFICILQNKLNEIFFFKKFKQICFYLYFVSKYSFYKKNSIYYLNEIKFHAIDKCEKNKVFNTRGFLKN